jgi:hypothetical protein
MKNWTFSRKKQMPRREFTPEQILNKLRQAEVAVANGQQRGRERPH